MTKREKLVYSYMVALSRLYGCVEWKQFIKVFNKYNIQKITKTEINNTPYYWNKRGVYCRLYSDVIVYSREYDKLIDKAMCLAEDKEYYIPTEDEILALSYPKDYMQQSDAHAAFYGAIKELLSNNPPNTISVEEMHKIICVKLGMMIAAGEKNQVIFDFLSSYGVDVIGLEDGQEFLDLMMNAWNNTRMWANRGYTPNELIAKMPKETGPREPKLEPNKNTKPCDTSNEFAVQFYKLWYKLIYWINEKHKIVPSFPVPIYGKSVNEQTLYRVREAMWKNPHYIDEFLSSEGAAGLSEKERQSISAWGKKFIKGRFMIHKHLAEYSVFQSFEEGCDIDKLYGVCGITNPLPDALGVSRPTPLFVETVLLPFNGKIIYDAFLSPYSFSFSDTIKESFEEFYKEAHAKHGIITTL